MTPEQQRITIAEACGWMMAINPDWAGEEKSPCGKKQDREWCKIPDYLNDLNAMHEAEKTLTNVQRDSYYYDYLHVKDEDHSWTVSAPAPQRAEAFLRTIGKWKD